MLISDYFKNIMSGKYGDKNIKFDIEYDVFDEIIKFANGSKINEIDIVMLIDVYNFLILFYITN